MDIIFDFKQKKVDIRKRIELIALIKMLSECR